MRSFRWIGALVLLVAVVGGMSACGKSTSAKGSVTVLMGTAPDSLDPDKGYTTQSIEATSISYIPLLTYPHLAGAAGTRVIPGLATAMPKISPDGKTYTLTLRRGLVYSDATPVKVSDVTHAIERSIKLGWQGAPFVIPYVHGADAYAKGKATSISGIKTDDRTGKITFTLDKPYGPFANVLAFQGTAPVPASTPMTDENNHPPPGVGPYRISSVIPNQSFTVVKNPRFAALHLPEIPLGHLEKITVKITSNNQSEAEQVLNNQADAFDSGDTVPGSLLAQIHSRASDRFAEVESPSTFYFFLNTTKKPFDNQLAREAVVTALDRRALQRLDSGFLKPECFFLPAGLPGHPSAPCPYGSVSGAPNLAKARALVQQSGLAGTPVTVYSETRSPRREFVDYYTSVLNQIGFKATPKVIADATYFTTIGNLKTNAQTGFADFLQDFPHPADFYLNLDPASIQPAGNPNFGQVKDPHITSELAFLDAVPDSKLQSVLPRWKALDQYVAQKAYAAVYGSEKLPKFFSNRIDFGSAIVHPLFENDWSSWRTK